MLSPPVVIFSAHFRSFQRCFDGSAIETHLLNIFRMKRYLLDDDEPVLIPVQSCTSLRAV